ncbi:MAG: FHA domain-containing protein [Anaerolineae bacterium]|nr:FHA domain-containing protein [Anaerolineae bacterium]
MAAELVCSTHGPYDATYGNCPYCSGVINRPAGPPPLDEDDMPTDFGQGGNYGGGAAAWGDEDPTDISPSRQARGGFLEEEDPTDIGHGGHVDDSTELEFEDTSALGILVVKEGRRRGRTLKIKDGTIIGRREGDVILDDPKVSNPHAKLRIEADKFVIWDFGTKNGTSVNGERIRAATELKENDEIKIGDTVLILKVLM